MFFLLYLTIRVHSESSVWINFWWSLRGQSSHDLFFLYSVCSSFFDICFSFNGFYLFFRLSISSAFLLDWGSALVPSRFAGISIKEYFYIVWLATGGVLGEAPLQGGSSGHSQSGREGAISLKINISASHETTRISKLL